MVARRRLDVELVTRKLMPSRAAARAAIEAGKVHVRGVPTRKPATMVSGEDSVRVVEPPRYVGRGGEKLEAALAAFAIDVTGKTALDVGASTGGFTDCLLQHGARSVVALDVGYGQLHWRVRSDPRVHPVDRTNIRHADLASLGAPFEIVCADLSFISLRTVAPALYRAGDRETDYVLLVKPQFEVGREQAGDGVVTDPALHEAAVSSVCSGLDEEGIGVIAGVASPLRGAAGNREFLVWCRQGPRTFERRDIEEMVAT